MNLDPKNVPVPRSKVSDAPNRFTDILFLNHSACVMGFCFNDPQGDIPSLGARRLLRDAQRVEESRIDLFRRLRDYQSKLDR
jgi:hypothetical protein